VSLSDAAYSLNIDEILGDFIPGSLFLIGLALLVNLNFDLIADLAATLILIALILAYGIGHLLQFLSGFVGSAPKKFVNGMEAIEEKKYNEVPFQVTEVEKGFMDLCREEFNLSEDYNDYGSLFEMLQSFLKATPMSKGLRFQAYFSFMSAMQAAAFLLALCSLGGIVLYLFDWQLIRSVEVAIFLLFISIMTYLLSTERRDKFERNWVEYVIMDVYTYFVIFKDEKPTENNS